jgi:hypothetical protein
MGLDSFIKAKKYIGNWDHSKLFIQEFQSYWGSTGNRFANIRRE